MDVDHIADISEAHAAIIIMVQEHGGRWQYFQNMDNTAYSHMMQKKIPKEQNQD